MCLPNFPFCLSQYHKQHYKLMYCILSWSRDRLQSLPYVKKLIFSRIKGAQQIHGQRLYGVVNHMSGLLAVHGPIGL